MNSLKQQKDHNVSSQQVSEIAYLVTGLGTGHISPMASMPKALGDILESLIGAVLLDSHMNLAQASQARS